MNDGLTEDERLVIEKGYEWIDENADLLLQFLKELVSKKSTAGNEGLHNDEDTTVGLLWKFIDENSSEVELESQLIDPSKDYSENKRENIYSTLKGTKEGGFIAASHTDVVPPGDPSKWPGDPFTIKEGTVRRIGECKIEIEVESKKYERQIRDKMDRIWKKRDFDETEILMGRGVYDNKASIVDLVGSMLGLEYALNKTDSELKGDLLHAHLVDEETKNIGVKNMVGWGNSDNWLGDQYRSYDDFSAVVLEGSYGFVPVVGFRGLMWVTLRAEGEASHASTPGLGKNAVLGMSKALSYTDSEDFQQRIKEPFLKDELLGELTIASGTTIVGGEINRVDHETGEI
ncbi:MAG: M20 family metallopeptidase, partial [Thermoplasmatota archaeon]